MMVAKVELFVELCKQNVAKTIFSELNLGFVPDFIFCAPWSGTCEKSSNKYDSATLFQHMAVMPQGIVGTLHPYQAGCFCRW